MADASSAIVIDATKDVPFLLESAPTVTNDPARRAILGIALDAPDTERFKQFTTEHLLGNRGVA
jgi:hypothetical protein